MMKFSGFRWPYFQCVEAMNPHLKVAALALAFVMGAPSWASLFVGNGGEGVWRGNQVLLRDLVEYGVSQNPFVGSAIDPHLQNKLKPLPFLSKEAYGLLLRKLTDLNQLSPSLGVYLAETINYYRWIPVEEPLNPFQDSGSAIDLGEEFIPLANRFRSTVRLQKQILPKMPAVHQAALIVHEGVSSLLRLDCADGICVQDALKVRELVGLMFTKDFKLSPAIEGGLAIPSTLLRGQVAHADSFAVVNRNGVPFKKFESQNWDEISREVCRDFSSQKNIHVELNRNPYRLVEKFYSTRRGESSYPQIQISFEAIPPQHSFALDAQACGAELRSRFFEWFEAPVPAAYSEALDVFVETLYGEVLAQPMDDAGREFWYREIYGRIETEQNLEQRYSRFKSVVSLFFKSPQFKQRKLDDERFVRLVYGVSFGKPVLDAYWLKELSEGRVTREQLLEKFLDHAKTKEFLRSFF